MPPELGIGLPEIVIVCVVMVPFSGVAVIEAIEEPAVIPSAVELAESVVDSVYVCNDQVSFASHVDGQVAVPMTLVGMETSEVMVWGGSTGTVTVGRLEMVGEVSVGDGTTGLLLPERLVGRFGLV